MCTFQLRNVLEEIEEESRENLSLAVRRFLVVRQYDAAER